MQVHARNVRPKKPIIFSSSSAFRRSAEAPPCGNGRYLSTAIFATFSRGAPLKAQFCPSHHEKHKLNQEVYLCFFTLKIHMKSGGCFPHRFILCFTSLYCCRLFYLAYFFLKIARKSAHVFFFLITSQTRAKPPTPAMDATEPPQPPDPAGGVGS